MIVVCGGGIAGLSFAISYVVNGGNEEVVILESGKDVESRAGDYSHSLIIRGEMKGVEALGELGVLDELRTLTTPSHGFFIARAGNPIRLSLATDWFGPMNGLRLLRFDLWRVLVKRAQELSLTIRWGHSATGYSERGVHVESQAGVEYLPSSLVVVADGARSAMRTATTKEGLGFLNIAIVGCAVVGSLPDPVKNRHGMIVGHGCSVFTAQETPEKVLVSMSFPVDRELDRKTDDAWIKSKVLSNISQFPSLEKLILDVLESPSKFVVNCRDRLPLKGTKPLIFIGDASHAVSPFAGAGANMALIDGTTFGKLAAQNNIQNYESLQNELAKLTFKKWEQVVFQQRSTITMCHSTSWWSCVSRSVILGCLPMLLSPSYKIIRRLISFSILMAAASVVVKRFGVLH